MELKNDADENLCSCDGTGWVRDVEHRQLTRMVPDGENMRSETIEVEVPVVVPCPVCSRLKKDNISKLAIPSGFQHATLSNFETLNNPVLQKAKRTAQEFVDTFGTRQLQNSLLIMGNPGVGKTHLAVAILREIHRKHTISARFVDFRNLLSSIRTSYQSDRYGNDEIIFSQFSRVDLLVVDELGNEKISPWVKEIIHRLVIPRYNERKATIFTTNFLDDELAYGDEELPAKTSRNEGQSAGHKDVTDRNEAESGERLVDRIGVRLHSRMKEMCRVITIHANDFRSHFIYKKVTPCDSNSDTFHTVQKIIRQFRKQPPRQREDYMLEAVRYHHELALESPDELAMYLFGRRKNLLSASMTAQEFIRIIHSISSEREEK